MANVRSLAIVRLAFYVVLVSIPFEIPNRQSLPVEIPTLTTALFLGATLLQPRRSYGRIPLAVWPFCAYLCVFVLAGSLNFLNDSSEVVHDFLLIVQCVIYFWAVTNLLEDESVTSAALVVFGLACLLRSVLPMVGIGRTVTVVWTGGERLTAFGQNENNAAMILAGGLIALLGIGYGRARPLFKPRVLVLPGCALIAYAIVETGSRGGLIALVAGLLALFLARRENAWGRIRSGAIAVGVLGVIAAFAYATPVMHNRLRDTAESGAMAGREDLYPIVAQMILEKPLIGWGPMNNQYELSIREGSRFYNRAKRDTHNLLFEALTATGLLGTIGFGIGLAICVIAAARGRSGPEGVLPLALIVSALTANMSGNWIASKFLWFSFAYAVVSARRQPAPDVVPGSR
ncbi:MAG TPA: O-antigen ligase family protein [Gemmatimonadales bacterium]|nr:O-antigen ligase family protein [Gemmatimonadales bacterium]